MAKSSAEAEYRTMSSTTSELVWLKALLEELGLKVNTPIKLFCDNQSAIHIASNPVFHERTKHIEIDYHFVREKFLGKLISMPFVKSEDQLTDILTKPPTLLQLKTIISKLNLHNLYKSNLRRGVEDIDSINTK